jgi:hypothetical protein
MVRDANNNYCMMPEGLAADEMMTCLCASPPTCFGFTTAAATSDATAAATG